MGSVSAAVSFSPRSSWTSESDLSGRVTTWNDVLSLPLRDRRTSTCMLELVWGDNDLGGICHFVMLLGPHAADTSDTNLYPSDVGLFQNVLGRWDTEARGRRCVDDQGPSAPVVVMLGPDRRHSVVQLRGLLFSCLAKSCHRFPSLGPLASDRSDSPTVILSTLSQLILGLCGLTLLLASWFFHAVFLLFFLASCHGVLSRHFDHAVLSWHFQASLFLRLLSA